MKHSRSFFDVMAVDKGAHAPAPPPLKRLRASMLDAAECLRAIQEDENEPAQIVVVCEPEGSSLMMGGLHPRGSLYERPVNIDTAKTQHAQFREVLRQHDVRVLTVREILAFGVDSNMGARVELEDLGMGALTYRMAAGTRYGQAGATAGRGWARHHQGYGRALGLVC